MFLIFKVPLISIILLTFSPHIISLYELNKNKTRIQWKNFFTQSRLSHVINIILWRKVTCIRNAGRKEHFYWLKVLGEQLCVDFRRGRMYDECLKISTLYYLKWYLCVHNIYILKLFWINEFFSELLCTRLFTVRTPT